MIDIEKLKQAALEALDNMDDYARMETGIAPIGAVNHLANFINTVCTRLEAAESQLEAVTQQARIWKMEALTHKSTVQECYQACTGSTGEPGDWNGANPVKQLAMRLAEKNAEIERLNERVFIEESNGKHWATCYSQWVQTDTAARALIHKDEQLAAQDFVIQQLRDALSDQLLNIYDKECGTAKTILRALAIPNSTKPLEAWYKSMVGEPVAYLKDDRNDVVIGKWVSNQPEFIQDHWKAQTPLHAIKPFPFKGE
jgi:hypothetical protein